MSLSVAVTPGYTFADGDILTPAILRMIAAPVVNLQGTISSALIPDGGVTTPKIAPGALSANTAGRNLVANGFITLVMLGSGIFTADASGRAPFANGFLNNTLMAAAAVDSANLTEAAAKQVYAYAPDTGTANNYAIALSPAPTSYVDGMVIRFKAVNANTGASTVNVNTIAAKALKKRGLALAAGNLLAGQMVEAIYDATNGWFQVISLLPGVDFISAEQAVVTAGTTAVAHGLGALPSRVRWVLRCKTGELGYTAGDEVDLSTVTESGTGGPHHVSGANATNVFVVANTVNNIQLKRYDTQAAVNITIGNWKLVCYATI